MEIGQEVAGYRIVSILGRGDFSAVYLVENLESGDRSAMKTAELSDRKGCERLDIEAHGLDSLSDIAGIPRLLDQGEDGVSRFLVMSLAPGMTIDSYVTEHIESGERFSWRRTLEVAAELLRILCDMSSPQREHAWGHGWAHRDIKAANVMVTASQSVVTLLDFGFSKEAGRTEKRTDDSFFRAGAARYAPPYKHQYPTHARPTHDVFAVGVLAYLMLTNRHPWTSRKGQGDGELLEAMAEPPLGIRALNNTVPPAVEKLIDEMLMVDDARRPSACDLHGRAVELLEDRAAEGASGVGLIAPRLTDVWRDELYGDVRLSRYEVDIINTREIQRLRRIRQLGLTFYVFASGDHSRLSHSVGTLFRAEQLMRSMEEIGGVRIDPETRQVARAYALTHDVTHISFGHTMEDELGLFERHDENSARVRRLVLDPGSDLGSVLDRSEVGRQTRNLFDPDATIHRRSEVTELVSGMVGADLLDYIDRDAVNLGLDHRIDTAILRQFTLHVRPGGDERPQFVSLLTGDYGIRVDREFAIEWVMRERYALFLKAYTHRAKIKASVLLGKAMALALTEFKKPLLSESQVEWYSDDGLIDFLRRVPRAQKVNDLADDLVKRRLPIAVFRARLLDDDNLNLESYAVRRRELTDDPNRFGLFPVESRLDVERQLAGQAQGIRPEDVFVYAARSAPGLKRTESHRTIRGQGAPLVPQSPWFQDLQRKHLGLWDIWVFVSGNAPVESRARLAAAAADRFGLANDLDGRPSHSPRLW